MPFLRLAVIFVFFAFSIARACDDFEIFANNTSLGCDAVVSTNIMYGDPLIFSVSPPTGDIKWRATTPTGIIIVAGPAYTPILENIGKTISYIVEKDGILKTINVNIQIRPIYTVSFDTDGGTPPISNQEVLKDSLAKKPTETLTKTGYDFEGWDFDFNTPITKDTTIRAKWKIQVYKVLFDSDGGSPVASQNVNYNSTASIPTPQPTRTGYDFDSWDFNFSTPITRDITIRARWNIKTYTVSFNSNGGSPVPQSQSVNYNSTASIPTPQPTRTGYDFDSWDFNFSTPITKDTTIMAKWKIKTYTVLFNSGGGSTVPSQIVNHNSTASIPAPPPTRAGYSFDGWDFDFSTLITENITVNAKGWTIITYNITYTPNDGTVIPQTSYNVNSPTIPMPTLNERCGYRYDWFDNSSFSGTAITSIPTGSTGDKNFYAKWTNTPNTPTISMLSYSQPSASSKTYDGIPIEPITVSSTSACPMGAITTLYNDATEPPKNAGTYQVYASIEANESYTKNKILLGSLTISKAPINFDISATVNDKEYDGTTAATIKSISFIPDGILTESDYSVTAKFDNPNAGAHITLNVRWLNGTLSQNYSPQIGTIEPISATIKKATNTVLEIKAEDYELSDLKPHKATINKSPYISDDSVRIEYKRYGDANYSSTQPNKIGNWSVRATINETANYEGKTAEAHFVVTRGSATTVKHSIAFSDASIQPDDEMSGNSGLRHYYVANPDPMTCAIKETIIYITISNEEPYIVLKIDNKQIDSYPDNDGLHYTIPFSFGKPGLHRLIYELSISEEYSELDKYSEKDTILIETPIPFDDTTVVRQKWNNVLFVNNNPQTNGGYEFKDFKWFKNNDPIGVSQFYSAGPSSKDTLNPKDVYKVTMHTKDGIRISTCEGKAKIKVPVQAQKSAFKKQVLGIKEKSLNSNSKIYNLNGKLTKETPAGVYIVEE
ncbi:hypothetical protein R83H12_00830 [Fibrobacteria bacterium R8-3-H12]